MDVTSITRDIETHFKLTGRSKSSSIPVAAISVSFYRVTFLLT